MGLQSSETFYGIYINFEFSLGSPLAYSSLVWVQSNHRYHTFGSVQITVYLAWGKNTILIFKSTLFKNNLFPWIYKALFLQNQT